MRAVGRPLRRGAQGTSRRRTKSPVRSPTATPSTQRSMAILGRAVGREADTGLNMGGSSTGKHRWLCKTRQQFVSFCANVNVLYVKRQVSLVYVNWKEVDFPCCPDCINYNKDRVFPDASNHFYWCIFIQQKKSIKHFYYSIVRVSNAI